MRTLALDLATHTGYAYRSDALRFGTWNFSGAWKNRPGMRFLAFQAKLDALVSTYRFDHVVYEHVRFSSDTVADVIWHGFLAAMQMWCDRREIPYSGVAVATLKKFATGNGRAKKPEIVAAAKARGWNVADDNQADAVWLLDYARTKLNNRRM